MPINILMPALSPTMTEGTLAKWLKQEGEDVSAGDPIAEIETDKATMEVEAVDEGKIGKILVAEGTEGVAVNSIIAVLLEDGEDASAIDAAPASEPAAPRPATSEPPAVAPAETTSAASTAAEPEWSGATVSQTVREVFSILRIQIHPHPLRHTIAHQLMGDNQNDLLSLVQILGHDNSARL